jgi:hypothetical protein
MPGGRVRELGEEVSRLRSVLVVAGILAIAPRVKCEDPSAVGVIAVAGDAERRCPSAAEIEQRVDGLLGAPDRARARMLEAGIGVVVSFTVDEARSRAEVELHGARHGRRTLEDESKDCRELGEALALALAILIDPSFVPPEERPASRVAETSAPIRAAEPFPPAPASPAPDREAPTSAISVSASLFAGAGATSRLTRPLALALSGGIGLALAERLGLRAAAIWIPPTAIALEPGTVEVGLVAGSFDVCLHPPKRGPELALSPCAGFSAGWMNAQALGYAMDGEARVRFLAVQAGLLADLPVGGPLGLWLDADALFPLTRPGFEVVAAGEVHPTKIPAFSLIIGPRVELF